jgi:hypothetical protein
VTKSSKPPRNPNGESARTIGSMTPQKPGGVTIVPMGRQGALKGAKNPQSNVPGESPRVLGTMDNLKPAPARGPSYTIPLGRQGPLYPTKAAPKS